MNDNDDVIVHDKTGRRRFLRTGTAAAIAGAAGITSSKGVLAADCDQNPRTEESKQATAGSDADSGAEADAAGCGRKPTLSQAPADTHHAVIVKKISG